MSPEKTGGGKDEAYYLKGKHGCLDTGASGKAKVLENDGRVRKITRNEAERLQGVPDNYTIQVSKAQALKMLGNGWTVDVIAHIFNQMAALADKERGGEKNIITADMHEPSIKTGT